MLQNTTKNENEQTGGGRMNNLKITFNAPVILGFVVVSFVVMILNTITMGKSNELLFTTYRSSWSSPLTYVRLFTHVLV